MHRFLHIPPIKFACLVLATLLSALLAGGVFAADTAQRIPIMIVGVTHLEAKNDLHNSPNINPLTPEHQREIKNLMQRLLAFKPTKVMIEQPYGDIRIQERYHQYLAGKFSLGANEVYQYGFRLAALVHNPDIYPIDTSKDYPFDYPGVQASAKKHSQTAVLDAAENSVASLIKRSDELISHGSLLDVLRYVNDPHVITQGNGWYLYVARVGGGDDYSGADLVSTWYARNVHIYANILRDTKPGDRVLVFIGAGHTPLLNWLVEQSPDLKLVDAEHYLR